MLKNEKVWMSIIAIAFSSLFLAITFTFPENPVADVGPAFLPRTYSVGLYVLAVALFFQGVREVKSKKSEAMSSKESGYLIFFTIIVTILYVFLIPYVGFYLLTPIVVIVLLALTRVKNIWTLTLLPLGTTLFIFIFFEKLLRVPVPSGLLFS